MTKRELGYIDGLITGFRAKQARGEELSDDESEVLADLQRWLEQSLETSKRAARRTQFQALGLRIVNGGES